MKYLSRFLLGCLLGSILISTPALAQVLKVTPQSATNVGGPYRLVEPATVQPNPDGTWFVSRTQPAQFFRLQIEDAPTGPGAPMATSTVPAIVLTRAQGLLRLFSQPDDDTNRPPGDAVWENAALAPLVCPVFDPAISNGGSPALLEFKVVRARAPSPLRRGALRNPPEDEATDLGYILVSLTEDNFPVVSFSNEGLTPVEQLWQRAGTRNIKPVQYDNTLMIAEDPAGNLVANLGSSPFKVPPEAVTSLGVPHTYDGDDDLGTDNRPRPTRLGAVHYASYAEFKSDFKTNRVYQVLRERRALAAREQWNIEKGIFPTVILINVNETRTILAGQPITSFRFFSEDGASLGVSQSPTAGGLRLVGEKPGDGRLIVVQPTVTNTYAVGIRLGTAGVGVKSFSPGAQPPKFWYAGSWADQPKYKQLQDDDWCPLVGCGPAAWAILFAWFEREWGVKAAFGNWTTADAPIDAKSSNRQKVFPVMDDLHDLCDVICFPTSDQGATEPEDMCEGGLGYTYPRKLAGYLRRSWTMKWTIWDDCPEDGALECASAIKKGYPAVVGLGWLWHYAVAYGYQRVDYKLTQGGPSFLIYRYLKCNMGWGNTVQWYNLCDTFFSSDFKLWNGPNAN